MTQYRNLRVSTAGGVLVVRFGDAWLTTDLAKGALGDELVALAAEGDSSRVLLNCEGVTYVSSALIGKLMALHRQLKAKQGKLALCELSSTVQEIVALMKLNEILIIRHTESEGLAALA